MGINYFTKEQIELLSNNKYVIKVSEKSITYSDEFKQVLIALGMPDWFFRIRKFKSYNC